LGLTLTFNGWRPYTEVRWDGVGYGFARGQTRDDVPEEFIRMKIMPGIENGMTIWSVGGLTEEEQVAEEKVTAMKAVVEESIAVEAVVEEAEAVDYASMTRATLMKTAKEEGHEVKTTMKKADLLELLSGE